MLTEEELIKTIADKTKTPAEDVLARVNEKEIELSGMVSRMGAAYIVGKELGVNLAKPVNKDLKINSIVPNMQKVNFIGKIVNISPVKEFDTSDGKGKVLNIILGDETGTIRISLWNEKTEVSERINEGDILEVIGGYTKRDYRGSTEVRLSNYGNLRIVEDVEIEVKESNIEYSKNSGYKDMLLDSVTEDEFVRLKAYLVRIFERKIVQNICPVCKSKLTNTTCEKHGTVNPEKFLVLSGIIDDGYGNINAVFFRDHAESVLKMTAEQVEKEIETKGEKHFFDSLDILGDYLRIKGVVRMNKVTNSLELICHDVKPINTLSEINSILNKLNSKQDASKPPIAPVKA